MKVIGRTEEYVKAWMEGNRQSDSEWMHPIEVKQHCIRWGRDDLAQTVAKTAGLSHLDKQSLDELHRLYV